MRYFRHRRGRILFESGGALLIGSAAAAGWIETGRVQLLLPTIAATLYGLCRAVMLLAPNPALAFDGGGLQVGRLLLVHRIRWDKVRDMRAQRWHRANSPIKLPSWFPHEREYLELVIGGAALASGSMKLRAEQMELPPGGLQELVGMLRAAQVEALGERGAAIARLGVNPRHQPSATVTGIQAERHRRSGLSVDGSEEEIASRPGQAPALPLPVPGRLRTFGPRVG